MSSGFTNSEEPPCGFKGKARANSPEPTERTPLLAPDITAGAFTSRDDILEVPGPSHHRLYSKLLSVFLLSLSLCILFVVLIALIAYSYGSRASGIAPEALIQRGLVVSGPDSIMVINVTADGLWVRVSGQAGVDVGAVLGVKKDRQDGLLHDWWKSLGRWGIRELDTISVTPSITGIYSEHAFLANITTPPIELPLAADPPPDKTWLREFSLPVLLQPTKDVPALIRFVRDSWQDGTINVRAVVSEALIAGGHLNGGGWRKALKLHFSHIQSTVRMKIPALPGFPPPGHNNPLPSPSELITLKSFVITSDHDHLLVRANASVLNPAPSSVQFKCPGMPFTIHLPSADGTSAPLPVASVTTHPFTLTHPNITISMSGSVLPLDSGAAPTLSAFLSNYVSARDTDVMISTPLFPDLTMNAVFPAPHPKPRILQNVTIKDMRIKPTGAGTMTASGTVMAKVVLPKGIKVGLVVVRILPDVLVFDGEVPDSDFLSPSPGGVGWAGLVHDDKKAPPAPPLPDPLPEGAFAHIRPDEWLVSTSVPVESGEDEGSAVNVTAKITDVPLEVLPGREREFRNFVGKVIFGTQGALAGVQGETAVAVRVQGLPFENGHGGKMELNGLPFHGSVLVGKKNMLVDGSLEFQN